MYLAYASRIRMPGRKVLSAAISECRPAMGPRPSLLNREQNMFPRLLAVVFLLVEVLGLSERADHRIKIVGACTTRPQEGLQL